MKIKEIIYDCPIYQQHKLKNVLKTQKQKKKKHSFVGYSLP